MKRCRDPKPPFAMHRKAEDYIGFVKKNHHVYVTGNVTYEACNDCRWSIDVVRIFRGIQQFVFRVKDLDSSNFLIKTALNEMGILIDPKTNNIRPGVYILPNVELSDMEKQYHVPFKFFGGYEYKYIYKYYSPNETHICWIAKASNELVKSRKKPKPKNDSLVLADGEQVNRIGKSVTVIPN